MTKKSIRRFLNDDPRTNAPGTSPLFSSEPTPLLVKPKRGPRSQPKKKKR